jgi:hypothetical protein
MPPTFRRDDSFGHDDFDYEEDEVEAPREVAEEEQWLDVPKPAGLEHQALLAYYGTLYQKRDVLRPLKKGRCSPPGAHF